VHRPSCVSKLEVFALKTWLPMMSLGRRSGVHWMRLKFALTASAIAWAAVVLARPGTLSSRM